MNDTKFCPHCGSQILASDKFCGDCGRKTDFKRIKNKTPAPGRIELWRRIALLTSILLGIALYFYVTPAVVSVTAVDWEKEQADELKSVSGYVSKEDQRISQLPLKDYIKEKTGGKVTLVDSKQWDTFFQQVQLASNGRYARSSYSDRVSNQDKDGLWKPQGTVPVFFKPGELPFEQWGLNFQAGEQIYLNKADADTSSYLLLEYKDYLSSVTAMSKPYRTAPGGLYHPYRLIGILVMSAGLLLYLFLPRRKNTPEDIAYARGRLVAGDIVALMILLLFYSLPFVINGGTAQSITSMWPISIVMWLLALLGVVLLYYSAWYASYRIELSQDALYLITLKGVRECRFDEIVSVNLVSLRNPGWFRKLFMAVALLSLMGERNSPQPVGTAILTDSAAYGGLEIQCNEKPFFIWFTDQLGNTIIPNFNRVPEAIQSAGISINKEPREIEGFSMFM
ncbi:MAG: zinc-ribbon domain-containing protein [Clostridiales bacterium]|nr:zinc-ribbon domain-containing protein [Clostridiales bacterium]MCF8021255.1 zinc-ribbon domain-containing protein [Clostridiales bacterium]